MCVFGTMPQAASPTARSFVVPLGQHRLMPQTMQRGAAVGAAEAAWSAASAAQPSVAELVASGQRSIDLICTDVDGTLMNSKNQLSPAVEAAVNAATRAGVPLVLATGKAQGPWIHDVLPRLESRFPQIYLQGLLITCPDEGVLYSRALAEAVVLEAIEFAERHGLTLTAYCGSDRILCKSTDEHTDRLVFYREPTPEAVGRLEPYLGRLEFYKVIFMAPHQRILEVQSLADAAFAGKAALTRALPGMIEVLPPGASKGSSVGWLLQRLGVEPERVMALGDGDNDVEMLDLVGLGVAMGNAGRKAREAADVVVSSNDEDGVAEAVRRFVLAPRGLA